MNKQQLSNFINQYTHCFKTYDLNALKNHYKLGCTLSTPDKLVLIETETDFACEFEQIFTQLKAANTANFLFSNISYTRLNTSTIVLGGTWVFSNNLKEAFAEFYACYHLIKENEKIKIISVVSHDISNAIVFAEK